MLFRSKHDLVITRSVSPPSRVMSPTFEFTFFTPRMAELIGDVDLGADHFSVGPEQYNVPVGKRILVSLGDLTLTHELNVDGYVLREYEFTFTYKLESIHPLFEAPCKEFVGTGSIASDNEEGWELEDVYFNDDHVNEFLDEQECRPGKAFEFVTRLQIQSSPEYDLGCDGDG